MRNGRCLLVPSGRTHDARRCLAASRIVDLFEVPGSGPKERGAEIAGSEWQPEANHLPMEIALSTRSRYPTTWTVATARTAPPDAARSAPMTISTPFAPGLHVWRARKPHSKTIAKRPNDYCCGQSSSSANRFHRLRMRTCFCTGISWPIRNRGSAGSRASASFHGPIRAGARSTGRSPRRASARQQAYSRCMALHSGRQRPCRGRRS